MSGALRLTAVLLIRNAADAVQPPAAVLMQKLQHLRLTHGNMVQDRLSLMRIPTQLRRGENSVKDGFHLAGKCGCLHTEAYSGLGICHRDWVGK